MPYVRGWMQVDVWVSPGRPDLPERPGLPSRPDWRPEHPWVPDEPGIGGGPVLPGRPTLPPDWERPGLPPDWERPELPPRPSLPPSYPIVDVDDIGGHPPLPDLDMPGHWGRVGDQGFPAWIVDPGEPPQVGEDYEGRQPTRGQPGTWVTVAYHGAVAWAWIPTPGERPEMPSRPGRPQPK